MNSDLCFELTVFEDSIAEDNELLLLQLQSNDSAVLILCTNVSVTILDDDSKMLCELHA